MQAGICGGQLQSRAPWLTDRFILYWTTHIYQYLWIYGLRRTNISSYFHELRPQFVGFGNILLLRIFSNVLRFLPVPQLARESTRNLQKEWYERIELFFSNALRCFQNINSFFGLFWFLCTSIYRPCVVQTNQAQVNEVLEYNVRAVSRLFSDREAPSLRCHWFHAFHDWLEQCFICFKARTGLDASFIQLGGPRLTPAAEWCSVTWLNVGVSTLLTWRCVKLLVAHVSSRFSLSFAVLFLGVNLLLCLSLPVFLTWPCQDKTRDVCPNPLTLVLPKLPMLCFDRW